MLGALCRRRLGLPNASAHPSSQVDRIGPGSNLTFGDPLDGGDDFVGVLGPGKGLWVCIGVVEEAVDGIFRFARQTCFADCCGER